jgi:hypothetical protein
MYIASWIYILQEILYELHVINFNFAKRHGTAVSTSQQ